MDSRDAVTPQTVFASLTRARVVEIGRELEVHIPTSLSKERQLAKLAASPRFDFGHALRFFSRDELRQACREAGLDDSGRARIELARRLAAAAGESLGPQVDPEDARDLFTPRRGDIAVVRQRQYLVEQVHAAQENSDAPMTLVRLSCLDDDAAGRTLEVLWELELGARILQPEAHGLGTVSGLDSADHFGAYLSALKWNCVTATDNQLFQAPFRAGIQLWNHQLIPLQKALELPRANLFIADDVGLGKTIEAGLVIQELRLRQRVDFVLVVCPASIVLQWRDEMRSRFGLYFEVYNSDFVGRRQKERGFGVNPWSTHTRFVVSYNLIRRPEHRDPLLQFLGERVKKSLLVLDEAHTVAPASGTRYAIDSRLTRVVRDLAPRFENRLFLSATPHNGHSNSFSALLELLDPQRFTRGVPIEDPAELAPVMVRRLKSDLRQIPGALAFPERRLVEHRLTWEAGVWTVRRREAGAVESRPLRESADTELELARLLAEYSAHMKPSKGAGRLVFINLQKRLLSSVEAFWRTLSAHAKGAPEHPAAPPPTLFDVETYGVDDDSVDEEDAWQAAKASAELADPSAHTRDLLQQMLTLAERRRHAPDAKVAALLDWIRGQQCPAAGIAPDARTKADLAWSERRVIIFTEYGDTKRYLKQQIEAAIHGTHRWEERVMAFHGGMGDDARAEVQAAFNSDPNDHPVRILIATDAAREGVNLQAHCADLFHFDVPWNPARLEQRNGRIDRTLQPSPIVRCHTFHYPQRPEDRVLEVLVQKIERIQEELGSLGAVLMDRLTEVLEDGINTDTLQRLEAASATDGVGLQTAKNELESQRTLRDITSALNKAGRILDASQEVLDIQPARLREVLDVALALMGTPPLQASTLHTRDGRAVEVFELPSLPEGWDKTLDLLRPPRGRKEDFWEWRHRAPLPVVFEPPQRLSDPVVHLHLEHPFVQRALSRFMSQGFAAEDLHRVSVVVDDQSHQTHVIAFGRLSLFGKGAVRLHDTLLSVAAVLDDTAAEPLTPLDDLASAPLLARLPALLRAAEPLELPDALRRSLALRATPDFAALWPEVEAEADEIARRSLAMLTARGEQEATDLRAILQRQVKALDKQLQTELFDIFGEPLNGVETVQRERELKHIQARRSRIDEELVTEPEQLRALYEVALRRLEPVGLLYLWPSTR